MTRTCRTRGLAGRLFACGTTMNIAGSAGRACKDSEERTVPRRRARWLRIKHSSNISRRGLFKPSGPSLNQFDPPEVSGCADYAF